MSDYLEVGGKEIDGIPVLEIDYDDNQMFRPRIAPLLAEKLVERYRSLPTQEPPPVCIVHIKAKVAGSPLVRAVFELYKVLSADSGTLFCASYPVNFMESLTSLGLTALPGFKLAATLEEAMDMARRERKGH